MQTRRLPRSHVLLLLFVCVTGVLACVTANLRSDVPPQGWWFERGPVVPHESFPADCSLCHTGDDWHTIREDFEFEHHDETGVGLVGAHREAECLRCHNDRGPVEVFAQRGCAGCHEDVHRGELGKNCESCHDEMNWRPDELIAMHNRTRFPLVGAHAAAACWRCHPGAATGNFLRVTTDCATCHADDLALAQNPDHLAQGWTSGCEQCHLSTTWGGAGFTHTTWPLTGAHTAADCSDCHLGGLFSGTPNQCVDCHLTEYQTTTAPNHLAAGFPPTCEACHTTAGWLGASFSHSLYPLTGAHTQASCSDCHPTGVYVGTPDQCADCHLGDYQATTNPNHLAAGFPTTCETCHGTSTWNGATFSHPFPLTGDHAGFSCSDCHLVPGSFSSFSCTVCHLPGETNDDHDDVPGYVYQSQACLTCHPTGN